MPPIVDGVDATASTETRKSSKKKGGGHRRNKEEREGISEALATGIGENKENVVVEPQINSQSVESSMIEK